MSVPPISKVLILGSGGREHALAVKCRMDLMQVVGASVIVAPGNDGMDFDRWNCDLSLGVTEFARLAQKAVDENIELVIVGPDQALADGAVDVFTKLGLACFGPTQKAAQIEASKSFAKHVMKAARVRTAEFEVIREVAQLEHLFKLFEGIKAWVVKVDGLALGKGVRVCNSLDETRQAAREFLNLKTTKQIVVEQKLLGEELSWLAFCDGERVALLEPARDYKRLTEDVSSPNTGGMGAYSPVAPYESEWADRIQAEVFLPVIRELKKQDCEFKGILYAGLMITGKNYGVLEFNARFGDPEAQALLPRMKSSLVEYAYACTQGKLGDLPARVEFDDQSSVFVVGAAPGYPESPQKGAVLGARPGEAGLYFAGVKKGDRGLESSGGRVFGALGKGHGLETARKTAYALLEKSGFKDMHYRKDIGRIES